MEESLLDRLIKNDKENIELFLTAIKEAKLIIISELQSSTVQINDSNLRELRGRLQGINDVMHIMNRSLDSLKEKE